MRDWFEFWWSIIAGVVGVFVAFIALLFLIAWGGTALVRANGKNVCSGWGQTTTYPTQFRVLGFLDSGTCFARLPNGTWINKDKIVTNNIVGAG